MEEDLENLQNILLDDSWIKIDDAFFSLDFNDKPFVIQGTHFYESIWSSSHYIHMVIV